jgi:hypothetical protein
MYLVLFTCLNCLIYPLECITLHFVHISFLLFELYSNPLYSPRKSRRRIGVELTRYSLLISAQKEASDLLRPQTPHENSLHWTGDCMNSSRPGRASSGDLRSSTEYITQTLRSIASHFTDRIIGFAVSCQHDHKFHSNSITFLCTRSCKSICVPNRELRINRCPTEVTYFWVMINKKAI